METLLGEGDDPGQRPHHAPRSSSGAPPLEAMDGVWALRASSSTASAHAQPSTFLDGVAGQAFAAGQPGLVRLSFNTLCPGGELHAVVKRKGALCTADLTSGRPAVGPTEYRCFLPHGVCKGPSFSRVLLHGCFLPHGAWHPSGQLNHGEGGVAGMGSGAVRGSL